MPEVTARIEIPTRTIIRVIVTLTAIWFFFQIGPVLAQLGFGVLLALTLYPPVARMQARGYSKGKAIAAVFGGFVVGLLAILLLLGPELVDETQSFWDNAPDYWAESAGWLQEHQPWLYNRVDDWINGQSNSDGSSDTGPFDVRDAVSAGQGVVGWIGQAFVVIVIAVYLLLDGERTFAWISRDLPPRWTNRLRRAAPAVSEIISIYVTRQGLTCLLCGLFSYVALSILNVPAALVLAVIAAVTDAVPLIGVVVATVPAVVLGLTQGWGTGVAVLVLFLAYQVFENYYLVPRLFGRAFKLSSFGMLVAVLIGWKLLGIAGVLLALPTAAALLVIERVWMEDDPGADRDVGDAITLAAAEVAAAPAAPHAASSGGDQ